MTEIELPPPVSLQEFNRRIRADRRQRRREETDRRIRLWGRRISDVSGWCYGGAVKTVQFPAYVFDLLDRHGKPDHAKIGPFVVCMWLLTLETYVVVVNRQPLDPVICVLTGVLSFASMSLMRAYIEKVRLSASSSMETKVEVREEFVRLEENLPKIRTDNEKGLPQ